MLGFSPWLAGLTALPWTVTIAVVAPFAGVLAGRVGVRPLVLAGMGLQTCTLAWIAVRIAPAGDISASFS